MLAAEREMRVMGRAGWGGGKGLRTQASSAAVTATSVRPPPPMSAVRRGPGWSRPCPYDGIAGMIGHIENGCVLSFGDNTLCY